MKVVLIEVIIKCIYLLIGAYAIKMTVEYFQQKKYFVFAMWLIAAIANIQAMLS